MTVFKVFIVLLAFLRMTLGAEDSMCLKNRSLFHIPGEAVLSCKYLEFDRIIFMNVNNCCVGFV